MTAAPIPSHAHLPAGLLFQVYGEILSRSVGQATIRSHAVWIAFSLQPCACPRSHLSKIFQAYLAKHHMAPSFHSQSCCYYLATAVTTHGGWASRSPRRTSTTGKPPGKPPESTGCHSMGLATNTIQSWNGRLDVIASSAIQCEWCEFQKKCLNSRNGLRILIKRPF